MPLFLFVGEMALFIAFFFSFVAVGATRGISADPIGSTISYQIHSRNDLREWHQLLLKGMTSLKIDPQYANANACALELYADHNDPRGCFLLSHDTVTPLLNDAYNTTAQVLAFISDPANAVWFAGADRFYIALCFKGHGSSGSVCDNSTESLKWLSLVDDFVATANEVVANHSLNVEFILDGDATPTGGTCLEQRWRPWNSTYIPGSDAPGAFESNDPTRGWDRFAVLNPPVDQWSGVVTAAYGKFPSSPYAWQVWEPADQATILNVTGAYVSRGLSHPLPAGLRIAINIDIAQYQVYAAEDSGLAWDARIPDTASAASGPGKPALFPVPGATIIEGQLYAVWADATSGAVRFSSSVYASAYAPLQPTGTGLLEVSPDVPLARKGLGPRTSFVWPNGTAELMLGCADAAPGNATVLLYQVSSVATPGATPQLTGRISVGPPSDPTATVLALAATTACSGAAHHSSAAVTASTTAACVAVLSAPAQPSACLLELHIAALVDAGVLAQPVCIASSSTGVTALSAPPALAVVGGPNALSAAITYSAGGKVYGATACISGGVILVNVPEACDGIIGESSVSLAAAPPPEPLPFHVGVQVDVALSLGSDGGILIFESHDHGWCPSTEARNKQPVPKLCDHKPPSQASSAVYLNWQWSRLPEFTAMLLSGVGSSPCSESVLHGCFGMGTQPAVALIPSKGASPTLAVLHVGTTLAEKDPDSAGLPLPYAGLVVDGWALPGLP